MNVPYICKAHRQHNSIVMTIPKGICVALDIKAGDILCLDLQCGKGEAIFTIQMKGPLHNDKSQEHSVKQNSSGRT